MKTIIKQIVVLVMLTTPLFTYIGYTDKPIEKKETRKINIVYTQEQSMIDFEQSEKFVNTKIEAKLEDVEEYQSVKAELHERAKEDYEAYLASLERQRQATQYVTQQSVETANTASTEGHVGYYELTAYTWTGNTCANGSYPTDGVTIASNTLPLGTRVYIEGIGERVVEDTGGMGNGVIDIYMDSYDDCIQFGRQSADVYILE